MHESLLKQAYQEHESELLRYLARRLGSKHLASDIAHDVYLKLLGGVNDTEIRDRRAYLFSMAANLATDHLRAERRRGEILEESSDTVWRRSDELTPERHALAKAELRFLECAVMALPERARQVFHLNRFKGKSQAEIAEYLGMGVTTVYKDLNLVMEALRHARRDFQTNVSGDRPHRK